MDDRFDEAHGWARDWLMESAFPIWWDKGADHQRGGFWEKLDQQGNPVDVPRRIRVQARQVYVYAEAGRLGWDGPWLDAVEHGISYIRKAYKRPDGLFRGAVDSNGASVKEDYDLYDQAFVMLALSAAYRAQGRPAAVRDEALALLDTLRKTLDHPRAGFEEAAPRKLPLRSNPHMHMLEALLAWVAVDGGAPFRDKAQEIVTLALDHMIDPATGAIGEYFDGEWNFAADPDGGVREPGHQFEWAFLLDHAAHVLGGEHRQASARLEAFGSQHGVDRARQVAIFSVDAAGKPIDPDARLWSQTERLRTSLILAERFPDEAERLRQEAAHSFTTLQRFLDVPVRGLWYDRMLPDGTLVDEPAPASSLYHIVTGLTPLIG